MSEITSYLEDILKSRGDVSFYRTNSKLDFKFFYYKDQPKIQISIQPQFSGQKSGIQQKGNVRYNYKENQYIMLTALEVYEVIEFLTDKTRDKLELIHKLGNSSSKLQLSKLVNNNQTQFGFIVNQNKNGNSVSQKIVLQFKELMYALDVQKFFIQSGTTMLFIKNGIEIAKKYSNNPDENNNVETQLDDNTDFGFNLDSDFE